MNEAKRYDPAADQPLHIFHESAVIHAPALKPASLVERLRRELQAQLEASVGGRLMAYLRELPPGRTVEVQLQHQVIPATQEEGVPMGPPDERHVFTLRVFPARQRGPVEVIISQQELMQWNAVGAVCGLGGVDMRFPVKCPQCGTKAERQIDLGHLTMAVGGKLDISFCCERCLMPVEAVAKIEEPPARKPKRLTAANPVLLEDSDAAAPLPAAAGPVCVPPSSAEKEGA